MKAENRARLVQACRWGAVLLLGIAYSIAAYRASAGVPDLAGALVAILPLVGLAFVMAWRSSQRIAMLVACVAACGALYAARNWLVAHYNWVFLMQHAGIYALLGVAFGRTLAAGSTPMVTAFASLVHRTMSPVLLAYTRGVTWAWTIYFAAIAAISLVLFWLAPIAIWSAFANLVTPVLLVLMFTAEYAVRCWMLPPEDRAGPIEAIQAYREHSSRRTAQQP